MQIASANKQQKIQFNFDEIGFYKSTAIAVAACAAAIAVDDTTYDLISNFVLPHYQCQCCKFN